LSSSGGEAGEIASRWTLPGAQLATLAVYDAKSCELHPTLDGALFRRNRRTGRRLYPEGVITLGW
jgi:hypothetical protein